MWAKNSKNGFNKAICHYSLDTFQNRLPRTVSQVIEYFDSCSQFYVNQRCKRQFLNAQNIQKIKIDKEKIMIGLNDLLKKVKTNDELVHFSDDLPDQRMWNQYLDDYENDFKKPARYGEMNSIAVESYVYRTMHSIFNSPARSSDGEPVVNFFQFFDSFYQPKMESLNACHLAANLIFDNCLSIEKRMNQQNFDLYSEFTTFLDYSLWGNRADLTIPAGLKACENFTENLIDRRSKILTDSTAEIFDLFQEFKNKDNLKIDIVLDNVGLELISDLCLVEFLYQSKLIKPSTRIRWFIKCYPWFVSDVTSIDFFSHIERLYFRIFDDDAKKEMIHRWNRLIGDRKWQLKAHPFFTTCYEYYKMQKIAPDLYDDLSSSDLVIFKGDLNYVKLLGNLLWPSETPFEDAIQNFKPTNLITLRAAKYNLVVNMKNKKIIDSLPDDKWYANGEYAMISMYRKN